MLICISWLFQMIHLYFVFTITENKQAGDKNMVPTFEIKRKAREFYKRFRLQGCTILGKFFNLPNSTDVDIHRWYELAMTDLRSKICSGVDCCREFFIDVFLRKHLIAKSFDVNF